VKETQTLAEQEQPQSIDVPFSEPDIARRVKLVHIEHDDLARLVAAKAVIVPRAEHYATIFFEYLAGIEEAAALFAQPALLEEARRLKREHLIALPQGHYGKNYVDSVSGSPSSTAGSDSMCAYSSAPITI
jgi:hypothetical protein